MLAEFDYQLSLRDWWPSRFEEGGKLVTQGHKYNTLLKWEIYLNPVLLWGKYGNRGWIEEERIPEKK